MRADLPCADWPFIFQLEKILQKIFKKLSGLYP